MKCSAGLASAASDVWWILLFPFPSACWCFISPAAFCGSANWTWLRGLSSDHFCAVCADPASIRHLELADLRKLWRQPDLFHGQEIAPIVPPIMYNGSVDCAEWAKAHFF